MNDSIAIKKKAMVVSLGVLAVAFFFLLRYNFLSPWKLYSDSYKFLLIAHSFSEFKSPLDLFPQVDWSFTSLFYPYKWLYPVLIALAHKITGIFNATVSLENSAHLVTSLSSISIPFIAGLLVFKKTKHKLLAIATALILGISGSQLIWSGYIITETLALALLLLYFSSDKPYQKGFLALLLVLTRPEFIIVPLISLAVEQVKRFKPAILPKLQALSPYLLLAITALLFIKTTFLFTYWQFDLLTITVSVALIIASIKLRLDNKPLLPDLFITFLTLSAIYTWFNPNIERYGVILLPLLLLSAILLVANDFDKIINVNKMARFSKYLALIVVTIFQIYSLVSYPVAKTVDYHAEVAQKVVTYAKENGYTEIFAFQTDPLVYQALSWNSGIHIKSLKNANLDEITNEKWYNTLVLMDESAKYFENKIDLSQFTKVIAFTPKAPFKTNNDTKLNAQVELWQKRSQSE